MWKHDEDTLGIKTDYSLPYQDEWGWWIICRWWWSTCRSPLSLLTLDTVWTGHSLDSNIGMFGNVWECFIIIHYCTDVTILLNLRSDFLQLCVVNIIKGEVRGKNIQSACIIGPKGEARTHEPRAPSMIIYPILYTL